MTGRRGAEPRARVPPESERWPNVGDNEVAHWTLSPLVSGPRMVLGESGSPWRGVEKSPRDGTQHRTSHYAPDVRVSALRACRTSRRSSGRGPDGEVEGWLRDLAVRDRFRLTGGRSAEPTGCPNRRYRHPVRDGCRAANLSGGEGTSEVLRHPGNLPLDRVVPQSVASPTGFEPVFWP